MLMRNKPLFITFILLFSIFLVLYMMQATGYYEYKANKQTNMTNVAIEQFEQDIKAGKQIDIKKYKVEEEDNSNKIGKVTLRISRALEKGVNKIVKGIFKSIAKVVEE